jgi:hypothetical protein
MDSLAETLDVRLRQWKPETAAHVREQVSELIARADRGESEPSEAELDAGYRDMCLDVEREALALEWCDALVGDTLPEAPGAAR